LSKISGKFKSLCQVFGGLPLKQGYTGRNRQRCKKGKILEAAIEGQVFQALPKIFSVADGSHQ
jgi:hypothetical protein